MTVLRAPLRSPLRSPLYGPLAGKYGNAALALLRGKQGFAISVPDDAVAVVDNATPANNFIGTMAQALAAGILVNASPPTKMLFNSSGMLTSGSNLRCQYSAAGVPLGFLPEPQRTNKVTARKHNPTDITNVVKAGNASAVLSVVDDSAELAAEGLLSVCTNGMVYKLDNTLGGSGTAYMQFAGATGNTNTHIASAFVRGVGADPVRVRNSTLGGASVAAGGGYSRGVFSFTPANSSDILWIAASINNVTYAILPCLEEGAFVTSVIGGDTTSAVTRNADNLYVDLTKVPFGAEYTIIAHAQPSPDTASTAFVVTSVHDTTTNNRMRLINGAAGTGAMIGSVISNNSATAAITSGGGVVTNAFKAAFACATDDFQLVIDGASIGVDNSGATPISPTQLGIGIPSNNTAQWAAPIGFVALIPERLSQADMIARTTL